MGTRPPAVAGRFYPAGRDSCVEEIEQCLRQYELPDDLPETIVAAIVPHAGWTFSGPLAALAFSAVKKRHEKVDTFVLLGVAHSYFGRTPAVYATGAWATPLGEIAVDQDLAGAILEAGTAEADPDAHAYEHSIEVQLPFIQHLFGPVRIVPVAVPANDSAVRLGESLGALIKASPKTIVCVGTTDLTHYGPGYGFTPMGVGRQALEWASRVNDKKFIDAALALDADRMLAEAAEHCNACGPGAAAAAVAAAKTLGRTAGVLLAHTTSADVMAATMGTTSSESVGYAAIVF